MTHYNHEHGGVYVVDKKTGKPVRQQPSPAEKKKGQAKEINHDSRK